MDDDFDLDAPIDEPSGAVDPRDPDWDVRATRHLRAIRALETKEHRTRQAFDREIQALEDRRDMALAPIRKRIAWHTEPLVSLHRAMLALDPKNNKTVVLPYGKLTSSTPQKPTVRVMNPEAFVEWARSNAPDLLATKYSPIVKAVTAAVGDRLLPMGAPTPTWSVDIADTNGEVVPGLTLGLNDTAFSIHMDDEL